MKTIILRDADNIFSTLISNHPCPRFLILVLGEEQIFTHKYNLFKVKSQLEIKSNTYIMNRKKAHFRMATIQQTISCWNPLQKCQNNKFYRTF